MNIAQPDRFLNITDMLYITIGVIPLGWQLPIAPQNSFFLIDDGLAIVETLIGEYMFHGEEAAAYPTVMRQLASDAVYGGEARKIVERAIAELRSIGC